MRFEVKGKSLLPVFQGVLSQADQVAPGPSAGGATYQQVFDEAHDLCRRQLSQADCYRLFGYRPFLCPPPPRPITGEWWLWTGIGIVAGAVIVKLFL